MSTNFQCKHQRQCQLILWSGNLTKELSGDVSSAFVERANRELVEVRQGGCDMRMFTLINIRCAAAFGIICTGLTAHSARRESQ